MKLEEVQILEVNPFYSDIAKKHSINNTTDDVNVLKNIEKVKIFLKQIDNKKYKYYVSSFYRCKQLNELLNDSITDSKHLKGLAVDIVIEIFNQRVDFIKWLNTLKNICYIEYTNHIHIEINEDINCS